MKRSSHCAHNSMILTSVHMKNVHHHELSQSTHSFKVEHNMQSMSHSLQDAGSFLCRRCAVWIGLHLYLHFTITRLLTAGPLSPDTPSFSGLTDGTAVRH
ncbi:hypothetical protein BaRGS_00037731 [Batillaria attramentaria]|uniref:Uncharacterized protein n=1 Tax=Batillaria attramentaria TaxID=370345 RepID=A0ABD0J948_9CAEN